MGRSVVFYIRSATLRRALRLRWLARVSAGEGRSTLRVTGARVGVWPQTHSGASGGQTQEALSRLMNSLTTLSSREW